MKGRFPNSNYLNDAFIAKMKEKYYRKSKMPEMPRNFAILGIDLQRIFLQEGGRAYLPSSPTLMDRLIPFYRYARKNGIKIILTRHCHKKPEIMALWWRDEMRCDDNETEIVERVEELGDIVIQKRTYDAFYKTNLEEILKRENVETVVVTGVMTHLCCETTARSAFVRGFNVIFPIDGTITKNEKFHEGTLRYLSHGFAPTPDLKEVIGWMQQLQ